MGLIMNEKIIFESIIQKIYLHFSLRSDRLLSHLENNVNDCDKEYYKSLRWNAYQALYDKRLIKYYYDSNLVPNFKGDPPSAKEVKKEVDRLIASWKRVKDEMKEVWEKMEKDFLKRNNMTSEMKAQFKG